MGEMPLGPSRTVPSAHQSCILQGRPYMGCTGLSVGTRRQLWAGWSVGLGPSVSWGLRQPAGV